MSDRRLDLVWSKQPSAPDPFETLIGEAQTDADAAMGLALAYAELDRDERAKLLETLIAPASPGEALASEGVLAALALLLSVETDRELAETIARELREAAPGALAAGVDRGHTWGDEVEGGVAVARALHGEFLTLLRVSWRAAPDAFELDFAPIATDDRSLAPPPGASEVGAEPALDRLAETLWRRRRRHGPLPQRLRRIATLLTPRAPSHR